MYIRPLVNVHHVTVMSYVQRKKCYHTDLLLLGNRLFKNTVLFCTKKKNHITFNKDGKSIGLHGNQISQSNTFYYAQYPDFLKVIQILVCPY